MFVRFTRHGQLFQMGLSFVEVLLNRASLTNRIGSQRDCNPQDAVDNFSAKFWKKMYLGLPSPLRIQLYITTVCFLWNLKTTSYCGHLYVSQCDMWPKWFHLIVWCVFERGCFHVKRRQLLIRLVHRGHQPTCQEKSVFWFCYTHTHASYPAATHIGFDGMSCWKINAPK